MYNVAVFYKEDDSVLCSINLSSFEEMEDYVSELETNPDVTENCYFEVEVTQ